MRKYTYVVKDGQSHFGSLTEIISGYFENTVSSPGVRGESKKGSNSSISFWKRSNFNAPDKKRMGLIWEVGIPNPLILTITEITVLIQFMHNKKNRYVFVVILLLICVLLFLRYTRPVSPDDLLEKREIQKITISRIVSVPGADGGSQTETISTNDPVETERIIALLRETPVNRRIKLFASGSSICGFVDEIQNEGNGRENP